MSKKPKVEKATTPFQSIKNYNNTTEGFGGAVGQRVGSDLNIKSSLGELRPTYNAAVGGMNAGLGAINTPFEQQLAGMQAGNNAFYNYQNELLNRGYQTDLADATARYAKSGMENSTTRGAFDAGLATNRALQGLALQDQSLRFINDANRANVATNAGILDQLYTYQNNPSQLANNNIMTGLQSVANNNQFNAQAQNQANMQAAQSRNALIGNIIGSGLGLAGTLMTGGLGAPLMSGGLGSAMGIMGRSAGGAALGGLTRGF